MFKNSFLGLSILSILLILQSCGGLDDNDFVDADELASQQDKEIQNFLTDNSLTATKDDDTGIYYIKNVENSDGETGSGSVCGIYYEASILDGDVFDEHQPANGESLLLKQGSNAIVPIGLEFALQIMKVGESFTFFIPSQRAYSFLAFSDIIPANSIIRIELTLDRVATTLEILERDSNLINIFIEENELNDLEKNPLAEVKTLNTGVRYKQLTEGTGEKPTAGQTVTVKYKGTFLDGKVFDETPDERGFSFAFSTGAVIPGFDQGIGEMKEGEKALIIIPSNSAYEQSVRVIPEFFKAEFISNRIVPGYVDSIDPYTVILFEIELTDIQ